jgi:hypothetical protein
MAQLKEVIETCTRAISGLSEPTRDSYQDKLAVFAEFCAGREIHNLEYLTPSAPKAAFPLR